MGQFFLILIYLFIFENCFASCYLRVCLIIQVIVSISIRYEVNFQDGIDCGGAYIKLLSDSPNLDLVC